MNNQYQALYFTAPGNIVIPDTSGTQRLFRSTVDGFWYVRKSDGSYELFAGGSASSFDLYGIQTLDITGQTDIDMTGLTTKGIVILTSTNPTETIDSISNAPNTFPYTFRPESGLVVTFNDLLLNPNPAANLKLPNPSLVINGTNSGYLEMQQRATAGGVLSTTFFSKQYLDVYNN